MYSKSITKYFDHGLTHTHATIEEALAKWFVILLEILFAEQSVSADEINSRLSHRNCVLCRLSMAALTLFAPQFAALTPPPWLKSKLLTFFQTSDAVAAKHAEHIASDTVQHFMKGTPFASAPDALKLDFVNGAAGQAVAAWMKWEQESLADWKIEKVVEAAGPDFDAAAAEAELRALACGACSEMAGPCFLFTLLCMCDVGPCAHGECLRNE